MLEEEDGIVVADRGLDQALGVVGRGRLDDLQAGRVGEVGLGVLRVERPAVHAAAGRAADDERHADAGAVARLGGEVRDHVEGARDEVDELHLGHGPHPHHRGPDRGADDGGLGDRRVDDALLAELGDEAVGHLEGAAVDADVLAEQEDALVPLPSPRGGPRGWRRRRSSGPWPGRGRLRRGAGRRSWRLAPAQAASGSDRRLDLDPGRRVHALERDLGLRQGTLLGVLDLAVDFLGDGLVDRGELVGRGGARTRRACARSARSGPSRATPRALPSGRTPGRRARRAPSSGTSRPRRGSGRSPERARSTARRAAS